MHFVINVSLKGLHLFATADHSLRTEERARHVAGLLQERFPECQGYQVNLTKWETLGTHINIKEE